MAAAPTIAMEAVSVEVRVAVAVRRGHVARHIDAIIGPVGAGTDH